MAKRMPRPLAKSGPTEDTFLQCGHRARAFVSVLNCKETQNENPAKHNCGLALTRKVSWQWPQVTRHMPGMVGTGGVTGLGARLMILLQLGLGQAILWEELLQMSKQLQGHLTYFLPGGAFRIG